MKVLLIRPPYRSKYIAPNFPIGLASLAASLLESGHEALILDLPLACDPLAILSDTLAREHYPLVGIGALTAQYEGALEVIRHLRKRARSSRIVLGGPHASGRPDAVLSDSGADFVIAGEGEGSLLSLVHTLEAGGDLSQVPALSYRDHRQIQSNPAPSPLPPFDTLPLPAYHLLDLEPYIRMQLSECVRPGSRPLQILTSRGCPYRCSYCHNLFGRVFRGRSPEHVMAEIRLLHGGYGVDEFLIHDDIFNYDMNRAREIFRLVRESRLNLGFSFPNGLRAELMDEDLMRTMAEAGVHTVSVGIESASARIQRSIGKHLGLTSVERFLRLAKRNGLTTQAFFIIGFPHERDDEILQTITYARRLKDLDTAFFSFPTPYAGTEIARQLSVEGIPVDMAPGLSDYYTPHFATEGLTYRRLVWLRIRGYLWFYLTPKRLWRILKDVANPQFIELYLNPLRRMLQMLFARPGVAR